jgi:hypothetical protein
MFATRSGDRPDPLQLVHLLSQSLCFRKKLGRTRLSQPEPNRAEDCQCCAAGGRLRPLRQLRYRHSGFPATSG